MKKALILMICISFTMTGPGCQNGNKPVDTGTSIPDNRVGEQGPESLKTVKVVLDGGGEFPEFLVGTWRANDLGWEFVFEPDGNIASLIHTIARVRLYPGQITKVAMKEGGEGIFHMGKCLVYYSPQTSQLQLEVELDKFHTELAESLVEGSSTDILTGPVSEDTLQWKADWFSYPEFYVTSGEYNRYKLPEDPNENPKKNLIFSKVQE
ncbi:MAG: hypothetical protein JW860_11925 [Sedimentisphaerales bacterium]|nr:hypothetical protein [Sedimentisphaerales bacterium]